MSTQAGERILPDIRELRLDVEERIGRDDLPRHELLIELAHLHGALSERAPLRIGNGRGGLVVRLEAGRIDLATAIDDLEMQVRAGRVSGRSDIADEIALPDPVPPAQSFGEAFEMPVEGFDALIVPEDHRRSGV